MLIPVLVAVLGTRTSLRSAGAGVGALLVGIIANIGWNVLVAPGGEAVFIGLLGSCVGLIAGHAVSAMSAGKGDGSPARAGREGPDGPSLPTPQLDQHR